ncbi:hypothetical protein Sango_2737300 [Sesamum angolense]|uniref:RNase H type-1 domain-containing protein n=1 Tax=Sesamum angolense TaxID=2727404 RepID=A0AAE1TAU7_9LAMI|nr:hypothetical protein Sango_2737300 [Sesamum angolense]
MNLFHSCCRWRIRTGHSVNIWEDPWLPRTPSFRVITPGPLNVMASQVSELIDEDMRAWNEGMVNNLFWPEDWDLILQIPLSLVCSTDLLVWHYSSNGMFPVRSAYHLALALSRPASSSGVRWSRQTWSKIWQAHMPNKAKVFIWRAIRNILPTASNLHKRLPHEVFCCPLCEEWTRNLKLARKNFLYPLQVIEFVVNYLTAFQSQKGRNERNLMQPQSLWFCPPTDWRPSLGGGSADMAEALAAREAIRLALRYRWPRVILEGDNNTLMNKLSSNQTDLSVTSPIIADVLHFSSFFTSVSFSFVGRVGNSAADFLAGSALNQEGDASLLPPGLECVHHEDIAY